MRWPARTHPGPKEKLDDTVFSQPALFVAGLAAVEKLRSEDPQAVAKCSAVAVRAASPPTPPPPFSPLSPSVT